MFALGAGDIVATLNMDVGHSNFRFDAHPEILLAGTFTAANEYFRALLYYSAMLCMNRETPTLVTDKDVVPALDRLLTVSTASFSPTPQLFADKLKETATSIFKI